MAATVEPITKQGTAPTTALPHFTVQQADLVRELSLALNAVERKGTIPILGHVQFRATEAGLSLIATNLEIGISCRCDAAIRKTGAATLPARKLLDYVRLLPGQGIDFKFGSNLWAQITAGRAKTRIAGMSVESFPELPEPQKPICSLPARQLARMIQRVQFAISKEESRFTLNGALFEATDGGLKIIAADGHRLALAEAEADVAAPGKNLVPRTAFAAILKLAELAPLDALVAIAEDENHLFFTVGDRTLVARRMTGNFPDYARVLPSSFAGRAVIDRKDLRDAISRVRNFADGRSRSTCCQFGTDGLSISASSIETGESEELVPADVSGAVRIGFNADYLLEFLGAAEPSKKVVMQFNDAKSAMQMTPADDERYRYVVMPMRVS